MKKLIFTFFFGFWLSSHSAYADNRMAVVELFTSQGCSSCPPADAFLGELAMRSDVLALAYHVDYWDYIGWNDVHAQAAFTERQRSYAQTFNLRYIYTPQMVVSGEFETSGNKRRSIINAIEKELSTPANISLNIGVNSIEIDGPPQNQEINIVRVSFHKEITTEIKRGENRGKELTDYHIVAEIETLGQWQGGAKNYKMNRLNPEMGHAVFIQRKKDMKILSAIRLP